MPVFFFLRHWAQRLVSRREGQSLTEYALILALVAIAVVVIVTTMGETISDVFDKIVTELTKMLPPGP